KPLTGTAGMPLGTITGGKDRNNRLHDNKGGDRSPVGLRYSEQARDQQGNYCGNSSSSRMCYG
ncbi:MAG TPA: hypothetical protein VE422_36575, partial [Terriglobia bacterium]|nr:hypothetical protein [Terriglobia bacterium]